MLGSLGLLLGRLISHLGSQKAALLLAFGGLAFVGG